jgi:glycopeptide antibiotics resistance protein
MYKFNRALRQVAFFIGMLTCAVVLTVCAFPWVFKLLWQESKNHGRDKQEVY